MFDEKQCPLNWAEFAIQSQFAEESFAGWGETNLPTGEEMSDRNRQVKRRPFFLKVGGGEGHNDFTITALGRSETGILDRGATAIAGFFHRLVGESDNRERVKPFGNIYFHFHGIGFQTDHLRRINFRQHRNYRAVSW